MSWFSQVFKHVLYFKQVCNRIKASGTSQMLEVIPVKYLAIPEPTCCLVAAPGLQVTLKGIGVQEGGRAMTLPSSTMVSGEGWLLRGAYLGPCQGLTTGVFPLHAGVSLCLPEEQCLLVLPLRWGQHGAAHRKLFAKGQIPTPLLRGTPASTSVLLPSVGRPWDKVLLS